VQWSDLQRDPRAVAELTDQGDVRVRRRDGSVLLLIREDRVLSSAEGAVAASRALRSLLVHLTPDVAADVLTDRYPWLDVLSAAARAQFVHDFPPGRG
jgi:hypothetical protein